MFDAELNRKSQRMRIVLSRAAQLVEAGDRNLSVEVSVDPDGAGAVSCGEQDERVRLRFDVIANDGVLATNGETQILICSLNSDMVEEHVANVIKNEIAKGLGDPTTEAPARIASKLARSEIDADAHKRMATRKLRTLIQTDKNRDPEIRRLLKTMSAYDVVKQLGLL
jgi:hypothetical protein